MRSCVNVLSKGSARRRTAGNGRRTGRGTNRAADTIMKAISQNLTNGEYFQA
jgi:hypothetical protein